MSKPMVNISDNGGRTRSKRIITKPLTTEEFKILTQVSQDPFEFSKYIKVIHPQRGMVPFGLYPYQKQVLKAFILYRFTIVKKFRQAGLTELISLFCLWYAMFSSNKTINILSIKDVVAKKVLRKIKFMYRNLPELMRVSIVNGRSQDLGTSSEIEFSNGSIITSVPTTEEAGRSEALSLLVIDEAAIIRWADQIWASAFPTLSTGGRAILNSTPYGIGNFFHKRWVEACNGGTFVPINLRWQMHPERDNAWYRTMAQTLGPRRTAQEIDGDFLTSGNNVFDLVDIRAIEESLNDYIPLNWRDESMFAPLFKGIRALGDSLKIYDLPDSLRKYSIGADVATGRARDYSAFSIMDDYGEEAGSFKMKIPINEYSNLLGALGVIYNTALIGPESNDIGLGVAVKLQEQGYPKLHYSQKMLKEKGERKPKVQKIPGWYTTSANRPVIIADLEEDIRLDNVVIKNKFFTDEAYTFVYDDSNKPIALGKNTASTGGEEQADLSDEDYTDDSILATAITNNLRKIKQKAHIILPS